MSKRIRKIILPNICINFTSVILIVSIGNIISGIQDHIVHGEGVRINGFCLFACELFVILGLVTVACTTLEKLRFKNKISYLVLELSINYVGFISGAYVFRWMKFSSKNMKETAVIMIITTVLYLNVYFITQKRRKREADEINRLLKKREKEHKREGV